MNAPGLYDKDPTGFYYIPTYDPKSGNFYIRAAIEDPRPILGHEGIPGLFCRFRSPIISPMRSGASTVILCSSRDGHCMERKC